MADQQAAIFEAIAPVLTPAEKDIVKSFFLSLEPSPQVPISVDVHVPTTGQTGQPICVSLAVSSHIPMLNRRLLILYRRHEHDSNRTQVLAPTGIAGRGLPVLVDGNRLSRVDLHFRSFVAGDCKLGYVQILDEDKRPLTEIDLGIVELEAAFSVPFDGRANASFINSGREIVRQVGVGKVVGTAVIGGGGSGKSRLCENLLEFARENEFRTLIVDHPNSMQERSQLLRATISELATMAGAGPDLIGAKSGDHIAALYPAMDSHVIAAYRAVFSRPHAAIKTLDAITRGLTIQILELIKHAPLALYWRDLHWVDGETIEILQSLCTELQGPSFKFGVWFVFEGRDKEGLDLGSGKFMLPKAWLRFLTNTAIKQWRVRPWTETESRAFLEDMVFAAEDPAGTIPARLLPLQSELICHVLKHAGGNPMHMVEQLKWMYALEVIAYSKTGQLYLYKRPPQDMVIPDSLEELIACRIDFKKRSPEIVSLLALCAQIGNEVIGLLFEKLAFTLRTPQRGANLASWMSRPYLPMEMSRFVSCMRIIFVSLNNPGWPVISRPFRLP